MKEFLPERIGPVRISKIYLETTIFNFFVDDDRGFAHESTIALFKEIAAGKYVAYTSAYVLDELEKAPAEKRDKMMSLIAEYDISVLTYSDEASALADIYVSDGIIPLKYRTDGLHIAIAAVNDLDMIISMNFQHIVKRKTKLVTGSINALNGYRAVEISNPMEVIENELDK
ncbi:MAG: hypothetical protein LBP21_09155 [Synergistaceae bacterium]|jgi:hypothetical protein|nr:hypothetical protein [Synergistaceae bacterium]